MQPEPPPIRSSEEVERQTAKLLKTWIESLSADERAQMEEDGLIEPEPTKKSKRGQPKQNDAEHVSLGTCDDLPSTLPTPDEALDAKWAAERAQPARRELLLLNYVLPTIADSSDPRLQASIVALALVDVAACQGITVDKLEAVHRVSSLDIAAAVRGLQLKLDVCRADLKLLRYVMAPILADRRPGLEAETIAKAARIGLSNAERMEDVGQKHGVCRAAISFRVREWCGKLGVPLPRECKQNTTAYQFSNVTPKPAFDLSDAN